MKEKLVLSWSGGKDSMMALHELRNMPQYEVVGLLSTIADEYERVSHHGVRTELLERQAAALGIPLHKIYIPAHCSANVYSRLMHQAMLQYKKQGINTIAFGDIFLEDLRRHREENLAVVGMKAFFPIWKRDTTELVGTFVKLGYKSILCCVEQSSLHPSFAGRVIDKLFAKTLPAGVDPCGENGEFHSFVFDGPIFSQPIQFIQGQTIRRDVRYFCDLIPV